MPRTEISVMLDNIRSLDNVGLAFRLCELARVNRLYLAGYTGHPRVPDDEREESLIARHESRIFKTAVYAVPFQPWSFVQDPVPIVEQLKERGEQIIVLEQTESSIPYNHLEPKTYKLPATIIAGHERTGVRQELVDLADHVIEIPILGHGNSHNVTHATAIVLYHLLNAKGKL